MIIKNALENITSFLFNTDNKGKINSNGTTSEITKLGIKNIGIIPSLNSLWNKLNKNHTQEKAAIRSPTSSSISLEISVPTPTSLNEVKPTLEKTIQLFPLEEIIHTEPIDPNFTVSKSIEEQRNAHDIAKKYLQKEAGKINAEVHFVSPLNYLSAPKIYEVEIKQDLDISVFTWKNSKGVQGDIQQDGKLPGHIALYGVASQFNSCEATDRFTPKPGTAVNTYKGDPTQGPGAQLQFSNQQVEIINNAANLGLNGLCQVLDDSTKITIKHGYLTPETQESAEMVIRHLQQNGNKIEYPCIGNIPKGETNTEKVYEMLVSAPAFGMYNIGSASDNQKSEIEFLCALHGYRAQFQQAIQLAILTPEKQVIFKPTAPGLGVFGNRVENIAKAFYVVAKEHENQLKEKNIKVELQVFQGKGEARKMAMVLGLNELSI